MRAIVATLPQVVGNAAVNWAVDSFKVQGWRTRSSIGTAWQAIKASKGKPKNNRNILVRRGDLRRSLRILSLSNDSVSVGSTLRYALIHNQGFSGTVNVKGYTRGVYGKAKVYSTTTRRARTVTTLTGSKDVAGHTKSMNMPKRQYLPMTANDSPQFVKDMGKVIMDEFKTIFKTV